MSLEKEIELLQTELKQLEHQIKTTYEKIIDLKKDKGEYVDDLQQQITLARKLIDSLKEQNEKTVKLINKRMNSIPDVFDSKPKIYPQKVSKYMIKKDEKWTRIKPDGSVEYLEIQPGEWD